MITVANAFFAGAPEAVGDKNCAFWLKRGADLIVIGVVGA